MASDSYLVLLRVALNVGSIVPQNVGILMTREPILHLKLQQPLLILCKVYRKLDIKEFSYQSVEEECFAASM